MNYKFTNALMFAAGAVIGSAVTWKVLKNKYEQMVQEEIESVKEALAGMNNIDDTYDECEEADDEEEEQSDHHQINWDELEDLDEDEEYEPDDDELDEYENIASQYSNEKGGAEKVELREPKVLDPIEFGEMDGYKTVSLTYYADNVLEDEKRKIITNVDELIGEGSLDTFGEYEDDSVFVRNYRLRTDFEILKDYRTYEEATGKSPKQVGNE